MKPKHVGVAALAGALLCALPGCDCGSCSTDQGVAVVSVQPDVYVVRGQIEMLPEQGRPETGLYIHHEAIDDFVGPTGTIGMGAMPMPFTPGEDVSLDGLGVGDIVEFSWEVRFGDDPVDRLTSIVKLASDTQLVFRAAQPPVPADGG